MRRQLSETEKRVLAVATLANKTLTAPTVTSPTITGVTQANGGVSLDSGAATPSAGQIAFKAEATTGPVS